MLLETKLTAYEVKLVAEKDTQVC